MLLKTSLSFVTGCFYRRPCNVTESVSPQMLSLSLFGPGGSSGLQLPPVDGFAYGRHCFRNSLNNTRVILPPTNFPLVMLRSAGRSSAAAAVKHGTRRALDQWPCQSVIGIKHGRSQSNLYSWRHSAFVNLPYCHSASQLSSLLGRRPKHWRNARRRRIAGLR